MAVLSTATKAKVGTKAAKTAVKNPTLLKGGAKAGGKTAKAGAKATKLGAKAAKPIAKRRTKSRLESIGETLRDAADELITYGPSAAQELGLVEAPKPKRTAPRLLLGMVIGAAAMYFLDPQHGKEHRDQIAGLMG